MCVYVCVSLTARLSPFLDDQSFLVLTHTHLDGGFEVHSLHQKSTQAIKLHTYSVLAEKHYRFLTDGDNFGAKQVVDHNKCFTAVHFMFFCYCGIMLMMDIMKTFYSSTKNIQNRKKNKTTSNKIEANY